MIFLKNCEYRKNLFSEITFGWFRNDKNFLQIIYKSDMCHLNKCETLFFFINVIKKSM